MHWKRTYRKIKASMLAAILLLGSTGIYLENHSCDHCGIEISLSLIPAADITDEDCCGSLPGNDKPEAGQCDLNDSSCCRVETVAHKLIQPFTYAQYLPEQFPEIFILDLNNNIACTSGATNIQLKHKDAPVKYGGRQTIILISQYRT